MFSWIKVPRFETGAHLSQGICFWTSWFTFCFTFLISKVRTEARKNPPLGLWSEQFHEFRSEDLLQQGGADPHLESGAHPLPFWGCTTCHTHNTSFLDEITLFSTQWFQPRNPDIIAQIYNEIRKYLWRQNPVSLTLFLRQVLSVLGQRLTSRNPQHSLLWTPVTRGQFLNMEKK